MMVSTSSRRPAPAWERIVCWVTLTASLVVFKLLGILAQVLNSFDRVERSLRSIVDVRRNGKEPDTATLQASEYAYYPQSLLRIYDLAVFQWNCRFWQVSVASMQSQFDAVLTCSHADIGPGSGYYASHSSRLSALVRACPEPLQYHLFDINPTPQEYTTARLRRRYTPRELAIFPHHLDALQCDKVEGDTALAGRFQSCNMHFLAHCVPAPASETLAISSAEKFRRLFGTAFALLKPGGICYGNTILDVEVAEGQGVNHIQRVAARALMNYLQDVGSFANQGDTLGTIVKGAKSAGFLVKRAWVEGFVGFFELERPR